MLLGAAVVVEDQSQPRHFKESEQWLCEDRTDKESEMFR